MDASCEEARKTTNESADILCDPCEGNNETETAQNYCIDCNEFLCKGCAKVHRKSRMSHHHKMLDGDEMPKKKLILSGEDKCSRHDGKSLEYFCNNHGGFYCASCVTLEHRSCSLEYLTEKAEGFEDSDNYKALIRRIQKVNQEVAGIKDKIQLCRQEAMTNHMKFLQEVQEFRNNIETVVKAIKENAEQKSNDVKTESIELFHSFSNRSNKIDDKVCAIEDELDSLRACKQQSRLCIAAKHFETKLNTIEIELEEIKAKASVNRYSFPGSEIMKLNIGSWSGMELLKFAGDSPPSVKLAEDEPDKGSDFEEKQAFDSNEEVTTFIDAVLFSKVSVNENPSKKTRAFVYPFLSSQPTIQPFIISADKQKDQSRTSYTRQFGFQGPETLLKTKTLTVPFNIMANQQTGQSCHFHSIPSGQWTSFQNSTVTQPGVTDIQHVSQSITNMANKQPGEMDFDSATRQARYKTMKNNRKFQAFHTNPNYNNP